MSKKVKMFGCVVCAAMIAAIAHQPAAADEKAQGYYGLGVSVGIAEFAALTNQPKSRVVSDLRMAINHAKLTGCVSATELEALVRATNAASRSRDVYERIRDYRISLATFIARNCDCGCGSNGNSTITILLAGIYTTPNGSKVTVTKTGSNSYTWLVAGWRGEGTLVGKEIRPTATYDRAGNLRTDVLLKGTIVSLDGNRVTRVSFPNGIGWSRK
jgi:hypothetical protein